MRRMPLGPNTLFAWFFVVVTLNSLYVLPSEYRLLSLLRIGLLYLSGLLLVFGLGSVLAQRRASKVESSYVLVSTALILYGLSGSVFFGGDSFFFENYKLLVYLTISVAFGFVVAHALVNHEPDRARAATPLVIELYFFISLGFLIATGAVSFSPLPVFHFGFGAAGGDGPERYSQSMTAFCGLGAIFLLLKSYQYDAVGKRLFWLILALTFLVFSIVGGARGDLLTTLIIWLVILLRRPSSSSWAIVSSLAVVGVFYATKTGMWQDILVIDRFRYLVETGTLGGRDRLFSESMQLLADDPRCLIVGCGFNYFQKYYGYQFGSYPHNALVEFVITYGLVISVPVFVMMIRGIWRTYWGSRGHSFVFYYALFVFINSLKGGTLVDMTNLPVMTLFAFAGYLRPVRSQELVHRPAPAFAEAPDREELEPLPSFEQGSRA